MNNSLVGTIMILSGNDVFSSRASVAERGFGLRMRLMKNSLKKDAFGPCHSNKRGLRLLLFVTRSLLVAIFRPVFMKRSPL